MKQPKQPDLELKDPEIRERVAEWYARCLVRIERDRNSKAAAKQQQTA